MTIYYGEGSLDISHYPQQPMLAFVSSVVLINLTETDHFIAVDQLVLDQAPPAPFVTAIKPAGLVKQPIGCADDRLANDHTAKLDCAKQFLTGKHATTVVPNRRSMTAIRDGFRTGRNHYYSTPYRVHVKMALRWSRGD